jgi:agmatine deiminase
MRQALAQPVPAEWGAHRAMWLGFPSHADLWLEDLTVAQAEVAALARALAGPGGENVRLFVHGEAARSAAIDLVGRTPSIDIVLGRFGDIWLRDTGPIFGAGAHNAACFRFNGWGGKYVLDHDDEVAPQIAAHAGAALVSHDFVLEGGALDHDGEGTVLTTRQCLLNPNRNPGWTEADAESAIARSLAARRLLWLGDGLVNDHTDGHVDNLSRFVAPGVVACPIGFGDDDPNAEVYEETARSLGAMTDASGRSLQIVRIPSPGRQVDDAGVVIPASHMNFLIANRAVIVPTYGGPSGDLAVQTVAALFPGRQVIGLPSRAILTGGGSFHCISQQEPA